MMNKDAAEESNTDGTIGVMETDDQKPSAMVKSGDAKESILTPPTAEKPLVKRKRRSPEKPWKKPKDMPKRPLSAYNLFFKSDRERLLSTGPEGKDGSSKVKEEKAEGNAKGSKKQKKPSGIGFANLAKTIAARWKELSDEERAPYEEIAGKEKKKYDEAVAEWRIKQAEKKKAAKRGLEDRRSMAMREPPVVPNLFSSERSLGSFSDSSNPYPQEWFHTSGEHDPSHRDGRSMERTVPPVVDTNPASYDRRSYDPSMSGTAWTPPRQDHSSYYQQGYGPSDPYLRYSPEVPRNAYLNRSLFSHEGGPRGPPHQSGSYAGYSRDYYQHTDPSLYQHSTRRTDMRMPRASSLPMHRHEDPSQQQQMSHSSGAPHSHHHDYQHLHGNADHLRSVRENHPSYHQPTSRSGSTSQHPRSASMPPLPHGSPPLGRGASRRRLRHSGEDLDESYRSESGYASRTMTDPVVPPTRQEYGGRHAEPQVDPVPANPDDPIVENSLHSLTENLDDDAISFITSIKYS